jgi:DNA adenine methylase
MIQPLKWWGGKHYLAKKIIALMSNHIHYVEPYAGGLAVLLEKNPIGHSEVVNDLNMELTNFWCVMQPQNGCFNQFIRQVEATPFSEIEWEDSDYDTHYTGPDVNRAVAFFIRCRQSRAGAMKDFATLSRTRTRRDMNEQVSAWWNCIAGLAEVSERLRRVVILNYDAIGVIKEQDGADTLFYLDPPYLGETRTSKDVYDCEMSRKEHERLLQTIQSVKGKVLLSGYRSTLYDQYLKDWRRTDFSIDNKAAGGKTKRAMVESVWMNYPATLEQELGL